MTDYPDFLRSPENACKLDSRSEAFGIPTETGFIVSEIINQLYPKPA